MEKYTTIDTLKNEGQIYYRVTSGDKELLVRKYKDDDVKIVEAKEAMKVLNTKKNSIKNLIGKFLMPIILTGALSTSLTGCNTEEKEPGTTIISEEEPEKDDPFKEKIIIDEIDNNKTDDKNSNTDTTKDIDSHVDMKDLNNAGIEMDKLLDVPGFDIYAIKKMNLETIPNNYNFWPIKISIDRTSNIVETNEEITWDKITSAIDEKNIPDNYKQTFKDIIENYKNVGISSQGMTVLYNNIKKSNFKIDHTIMSSYFNQYTNEMVINDVDITSDPEYLNSIKAGKESGYFTDEEYNLMLLQDEYVLSHEFAHMLALYYDQDTHQELNNAGLFLFYSKIDDQVNYVDTNDEALTEGFADYMTYETSGIKTNKNFGYAVNQVLYLTLTDMLDINSIEDKRQLNTPDLFNKMSEFGFYKEYLCKLYTYINLPCQQSHISREGGSIGVDRCVNFTEYIKEIFDMYTSIQLHKGVSIDEIKDKLNGIINKWSERIVHYDINGNDYIVDALGNATVSITDMRTIVNNYTAETFTPKNITR